MSHPGQYNQAQKRELKVVHYALPRVLQKPQAQKRELKAELLAHECVKLVSQAQKRELKVLYTVFVS